VTVTKGSTIVLRGERKANLYKLKGSVIIGDTSVTTEKEETSCIRGSKTGVETLQALARQREEKRGAETCKEESRDQCQIDKKKATVKVGTFIHRPDGFLGLTHEDVGGPSKSALLGGNQDESHKWVHRSVSFVGDLSRQSMVATMSGKEVLGIFKNVKKCSRISKVLQRDAKKERYNGDSSQWPYGSKRHFKAWKETGWQQDVLAKVNRTILERVRCQESSRRLYLTDMSHQIKRLLFAADKGKTPLEDWSGKDVTKDEASVMKAQCSRQVESMSTGKVTQQVENDAAPWTPGITISVVVPTEVIQFGHYDAMLDAV